MTYWQSLQVLISRGVNVIFFGGHVNEMLSSRAYREQAHPLWGAVKKSLDGIFFWERHHCQSSYEWERRLNSGDNSPLATRD